MGSPTSEEKRGSDEGPVHKVYLDGYWIGKYELTFNQYDEYCDDTGKKRPDDEGWGRGSRPVINVSWEDTIAYCEWLSDKTGSEFKLPTEAQWENACRSGTSSPFYFGSSLSSRQANFDGNYPYGGASKGPYLKKTVPVGNYNPNGFGLYDMHGNVYEWCSDRYGKDYYAVSPYKNPGGPSSGSARVIRGGSWYNYAKILRSAYRSYDYASFRSYDVGFRLMKTD